MNFITTQSPTLIDDWPTLIEHNKNLTLNFKLVNFLCLKTKYTLKTHYKNIFH